MIPLQSDPAIVELKRIVENDLKIKTKFVYANLFEANFGLDSLSQEDDWPVFVFVAADKSNETLDSNNLIKRVIPVTGLMINIVQAGTQDMKSEELDPYINQMRMLGENLIYNMNKSTISDIEKLIEIVNYDKIFGKFDVNAVGVGMQFEWAINTGISGCFAV